MRSIEEAKKVLKEFVANHKIFNSNLERLRQYLNEIDKSGELSAYKNRLEEAISTCNNLNIDKLSNEENLEAACQKLQALMASPAFTAYAQQLEQLA